MLSSVMFIRKRRLLPLNLRGFALTLFSVSSLLIAGCTGKNADQSDSEKELPTIDVELVKLRPQHWPQRVRSQGSLRPDDQAVIGSEIEGRVDEVHVDLGDEVKKGTPLVTIRQQEFQLLVEQAEAELLQARSAVGLKPETPLSELDPQQAPPVLEAKAQWDEATAQLKRARQLLSSNSISSAEADELSAAVDVAEARYKSALNSVREKIAIIGVEQAELSLAKDDLESSVIKAPFDGLIVERRISPGTYVRVGDPAISIVRLDQLRYRGTIPERYALKLTKGQKVDLEIESVPNPMTVEVTRISPSVNLASRSLLFEAIIDNSDGRLRGGLFATARIVIDEDAQALIIPDSALVEFAGSQKVWKVVDGVTKAQEVLLGERREGKIEIVSGLKPGDVILQNGAEGKVARVKMPDNDTIVDAKASDSVTTE